MSRILFPVESDIPGLTKKLEVENIQMYPPTGQVMATLSPRYFSSEGHELRATQGAETVALNTAAVNSDEVSLALISAIAASVLTFVEAKLETATEIPAPPMP